MYSVSQIIASTSNNFELKNDSHTIVIDFMNNFDINSLLILFHSSGFHSRNTLSLHLENISGSGSLPVIDIYLNLNQENLPNEKNHVGSMALYGLSASSNKSIEHSTSGQNRIFDVAHVFNEVRNQSNWSKKKFKLTLIPYRSLSMGTILTIGRVALYFHQE